MICSQTATHVQTHADPINVSDGLYWASSKRGKKVGKSITATLQKLLLPSGHMARLQSQRDAGGGILPEGGAFQVHCPLDNTHANYLACSYASYGELVVLTLQEKESVKLQRLRMQQCSGAEIESKCETSNSCTWRQMNTQTCFV